MDNLYNKFRFRNRELFKRYGERNVKAVFDDISFFVNELDLEIFTNGDVIFYLKTALTERGIAVHDINDLAIPVIEFLTAEAGLVKGDYDLYEDILKVVSEVVPKHISDHEKFTAPLARRITEEFKSGDRSLSMDEVAARLKTFPELRFLPLALLVEVMDSVYDYFMEMEE